MNRVFCIVFSVMWFGVFSADCLAVTADLIFKETSQSIVLVKDEEGHGSGVVIGSDGRIMTSYHVVNVPLPLSVKADVYVKGKLVRITFTDVKLLSVHPQYDLAIIKVDLPDGVTMKPMKISSAPAVTGEECFVIGNPGGAAGEALRNSISTGIISAGERMMDDRKYIQSTAAINPGNSGGALVDKKGRLIGIVSFILTDTEGIGFAIPVKGLDLDKFIAESEREVNRDKAIEYHRIASQLYNRAWQLRDEQHDLALRMAVIACRFSLMEDFTYSEAYFAIGNMYKALKKETLSKYCFEKWLSVSGGKDPVAFSSLAVCENSMGNEKRSNELLKQGVLCENNNVGRGDCAGLLGINLANEKRYLEAAYLLKWSKSLGGEDMRYEQEINKAEIKTTEHLSDIEFTSVSKKRSGFSFEDMALVVAHVNQSNKKEGGQNRPTQGLNKIGVPSVDWSRIINAGMADAVDPEPAGFIKKIPESMTECIPAYGGLYLVMKFPELRKLGLFNIAQLKFDKYISLPNSGCLYACGGKTLLVYDPNQEVVDTYEMPTFDKTGSHKISEMGKLIDLHMGLFNSDKAIVSWPGGEGENKVRVFGMMDIPSMNITPFRPDATKNKGLNSGKTYCSNNAPLRLDPKMTRFVYWNATSSPSGFMCGTINGLKIDSFYKHSSSGSLSLLQDSSHFVSSKGYLLNTKGDITYRFKGFGLSLYAFMDADKVIKVNQDKATVIELANYKEIQSFKLPFEIKNTTRASGAMTIDRNVFASDQLKRAVVIDNPGKQLVVYKLTDEVFAGEDADDSMSAGSHWSYKLDYPQGTKYILEDSPDGVKIDASGKLLNWQIPQEKKSGKHLILLSVTEPDKEEIYEHIWVTIK